MGKATTMNDLKKNYENACNAYLKAFCEKHGYDYDTDCWVAGDVGTIAMIGDEFVDMRTIRIDIDRNAPEDEFLKWYDYGLRLHYIDHTIPSPNFDHWLIGCPRKSEEEIQELERLHKRVEDTKATLMEAIKSEKPETNDR